MLYPTVNSLCYIFAKYNRPMDRKPLIRKLIDAKFGGSQAAFARAIKKPPALVNHWLKDVRTPSSDMARHIEKTLNLPFGWMDGLESSLEIPEDDLDTSPIQLRMVPFFNSWVRAGEFTQSPDHYTLESGEEMLPSPFFCGKHTYAVTVKGDSMSDPTGYFPGDIVFVDPDAGFAPGDDVVAMDKEGRLSLKRYKEHETGEPYLLQLNGNKIIEIDGEWRVCGRVIFSARKR